MNKSTKEKILIFSSIRDESTIEVIKWLNYYNQKFIIINSITDFQLHNISINENYFKENVSAIWYRKLQINPQPINSKSTELARSSYNFLLSESKWFYFTLDLFLKNIKSLGNGFNQMDLNKIEVLDVLGNVVLSSSSKNDMKVKLNLSEMQNGNYFVRMYSGNSVSTKKITIVK